MDIGKSFSFVFEDEAWITKLLIAAAILLLGIFFSPVLLIPLIVAMILLGGYSVEIIRRVMRGELDGLPEWDNWGGLFKDGLMTMIIGIVYALPIIILSICLSVPIGVAAEEAEGVSALFSLLLSCVTLLYAFALSIILPAATAFYAAEDDLGAAFRFGDVFSLVREHLSTYLITFLMSWVAGIIGSAGGIVCGIGWLVTLPYAYMVTGHLYGQAYVEATGQALPPVVEDVAQDDQPEA
jgi:L-asparagine transporter-like permease